MDNDSKVINIDNIFTDEYIIPIYQRKYAWGNKEIEQLLEDIINAEGDYYLGTLIVNKKQNGKYEVIDGQQRLTTLYLLMQNLEKKYSPIQFEARKNYDKAVKSLVDDGKCNVSELNDGYECIKKYLTKDMFDKITKKLNDVYIVRVQVPENTDLNNYFEVMNTRGEQLELHHIAKARMINELNDDNDKKLAAAIWDACSNMDSYMIMNLTNTIRNNIFENDLSDFKKDLTRTYENINDVWNKLSEKIKEKDSIIDKSSIKSIIDDKEENYEEVEETQDNGANNKLASIISFPYFLLHVNATLLKDKQDNIYDDTKLLENLKEYYKCEDSETKVKEFIYQMMHCRFLFDKYIIKRDMQDNDDATVILKQYKQYTKSMQLINTFSNKIDVKEWVEDADEDGYDKKQDSLVVLESILRITYTSPRNMQWITELLKYTIQNENFGVNDLIALLENFCIDEIKEGIDLDNLSYGNIKRIVFTYLDYLLYRDGYERNGKEIIKKEGDYKVYFRNSVEHFYPRHPDSDNKWSGDDLDSFGNLALITPSANSKFSNLDPKAKIVNMKNIEQSPKLKIMASYIKNGEDWVPDMAKDHEKEMCKILKNEKNRKKI